MIVMPQPFDGAIAAPEDEPGFGMPRVLRLSDAEKIATDRLDGAAEGSLKEALATAIPVLQPASHRLADRIEEIRWLAEPVSELRSFHAVPSSRFGWEAAVPPAHAMPLIESGEIDPLADVLPPGPDVAWEQAWSASRELDVTPENSREAAADIGQGLEAYAFESGAPVPADAKPAVIVDTLLVPVAGSEEDGHVGAIDLEDSRAQAMAPLVNAYAENAKLAAEATAASHALHNLKLILTEQMAEEVSDLFGPERDAPNDPADWVDPIATGEVHAADGGGDAFRTERGVEPLVELAPPWPTGPVMEPVPAAVKGPPPLPPAASVSAAPPQVSPPLVEPTADAVADERAERRAPPRIVEVQSAPERMAASAAVGIPKPARNAAPAGGAKVAPAEAAAAKVAPAKTREKKAAPKVMRAVRPQSSRTPLDVGGFMAGFALSGAIGVVLYFVMTAS